MINRFTDFPGVCMRDELPKIPPLCNYGIVNLNKSSQPAKHWVKYYRNGKNRIYFDSYGPVILQELNHYLKTEKKNDEQ